MGTKAVGIYLRLLRERRGLTMAQVAHAAGVSNNYVWRIEADTIKQPSAANVAGMIDAVGGSAEDVKTLIRDKQATAEQAQQLALRWLESSAAPHPHAAPPRRTPAELAAVIAELRAQIEAESGSSREGLLDAVRALVLGWPRMRRMQ